MKGGITSIIILLIRLPSYGRKAAPLCSRFLFLINSALSGETKKRP
jgi:hypothetical protein